MKQLRMLLMLLGILTLTTFNGCSLLQERVYVDRIVEVNVEVPCAIKRVKCSTVGSDAEVVIGLATCIVDLKKEAEACR